MLGRNTDKERRDRMNELSSKYGYTRKQAPLKLRYGESDGTITVPLDYYDSYNCKRCHKTWGFFLPKGAIPCIFQTADQICCECCAIDGTNNWCDGKPTSYIMRI